MYRRYRGGPAGPLDRGRSGTGPSGRDGSRGRGGGGASAFLPATGPADLEIHDTVSKDEGGRSLAAGTVEGDWQHSLSRGT